MLSRRLQSHGRSGTSPILWVVGVVCVSGAVRAAAADSVDAPQAAVTAILGELRPDDSETVRAAAGDLFEAKGASAAPALERALESDAWFRRETAARALGAIGPGALAAAPALLKALRDPHGGVREEAALALGAIQPAAAGVVPALMTAMGDESRLVRSAAIDVLADLGQAAAAAPELVTALDDPEDVVRSSAVRALSKARPLPPGVARELALTLGDVRPGLRRLAAVSLRAMDAGDSAALAALRAALRDGEGEVRAAAAESLGTLGPSAATAEALAAILRDRDPQVRAAAAKALGKLGPSAATIEALAAVLEDGDPQVRAVAAEALGSLGPSAAAAVPALAKAVAGTDGAAEALGGLGGAAEPAVPALLAALAHCDQWKAHTLGAALMSIRPAGEAALVAALDDASSSWRVADILARIGPGAEAAVPALVRALRGDDHNVARMAAQALGRIGLAEPAVLGGLSAALESDDEILPFQAAKALEKLGPGGLAVLAAALTTSDDARGAFVSVLRDLDTGADVSAAAPALLEVLGNRKLTWDVRSLAAERLAKMGAQGQKAIPLLLAIVRDRKDDVRSFAVVPLVDLAKASPEVTRTLAGILRDRTEDPATRKAAVWGLGGVADRRVALPELTRALDDDDSLVRWAATATLTDLGPAAAPAVPALVRRLADDVAGIRYAAAETLAAIGSVDEATRRKLRRLLADEVQPLGLRLDAARALARLGEPEGIFMPQVEAALQTTDDPEDLNWMGIEKAPIVRLDAIRLVDELPARASVRVLPRLAELALRDEWEPVRAAAAAAIARLLATNPDAR